MEIYKMKPIEIRHHKLFKILRKKFDIEKDLVVQEEMDEIWIYIASWNCGMGGIELAEYLKSKGIDATFSTRTHRIEVSRKTK